MQFLQPFVQKKKIDFEQILSSSTRNNFAFQFIIIGLPKWLSSTQSACQCRRHRFNPWVGKIPWRRKWQPTPVFLPRKSQEPKSLGATVHALTKSQTLLSTNPRTVFYRLPDSLKFMSIFSHLSCPYRLPDSLKFVSIFSHLSHIIYFLLRLLKREENFTFIPRSREELPDNFPKEIPGICYFLEVRTGPKQPKPSLSSSKIKKVSYNIGTMFLRETSL